MATTLKQDVIECIEISKIDPNPLASRLEQPDIGELADSLRSEGQLIPIRVRVDPRDSRRYQVIFGQRRLVAARTIGWNQISAEVVQASDEEMLTFALTENLERDNYTDYEQGVLLKGLHEKFHKSIDQIASMLGKSKSYVSQHITMVSMFDSPGIDSAEAVEVLKQLSERQARILVRVADPFERLHLAKICVSEKLGVVECERFIGHPREVVVREGGGKMDNWRTSRVKTGEQIAQIVRQTLEGLEKKDVCLLLSRRKRDSFTLFDDFPPFELLDYKGAAEHNSLVLRNTDEIRLSYDKLKIQIFGGFAYATFFVTYQIRYNGKYQALRSRVTFIFIQKDKEWFIIHEHWSPLPHENMLELTEFDSRTTKA